MKFCDKCGILARPSNLRLSHFPYCQPNLLDSQSGFLKVGELPRENLDDFRMVLDIIDLPEKAVKVNKKVRFEDEVDNAISEDSDS